MFLGFVFLQEVATKRQPTFKESSAERVDAEGLKWCNTNSQPTEKSHSGKQP